MYTTSIMQDIKSPLDKVERSWIRKPTTLMIYLTIMLPLLIVCGISAAIVEFCGIIYSYTVRWFKDCWEYNET